MRELIFSGGVGALSENTTESFSDGIAFFVEAPDISDELELDFYLQFAVNGFQNKGVKLTPEPIADTLFLYIIPEELSNTGEQFYASFISNTSTAIEVWIIKKDTSLATIDEKLEEILLEVDGVEEGILANLTLDIAQTINAINQNISLGVLQASLAPLTLGTSTVSLPALTGSTAQLAPAIASATTAMQLLLP